jgi:hypothetical protein
LITDELEEIFSGGYMKKRIPGSVIIICMLLALAGCQSSVTYVAMPPNPLPDKSTVIVRRPSAFYASNISFALFDVGVVCDGNKLVSGGSGQVRIKSILYDDAKVGVGSNYSTNALAGCIQVASIANDDTVKWCRDSGDFRLIVVPIVGSNLSHIFISKKYHLEAGASYHFEITPSLLDREYYINEPGFEAEQMWLDGIRQLDVNKLVCAIMLAEKRADYYIVVEDDDETSGFCYLVKIKETNENYKTEVTRVKSLGRFCSQTNVSTISGR